VSSADRNGFTGEVFPQFTRGFGIFFCRHSGEDDMGRDASSLMTVIQCPERFEHIECRFDLLLIWSTRYQYKV
jgi:hypothetical protein